MCSKIKVVNGEIESPFFLITKLYAIPESNQYDLSLTFKYPFLSYKIISVQSDDVDIMEYKTKTIRFSTDKKIFTIDIKHEPFHSLLKRKNQFQLFDIAYSIGIDYHQKTNDSLIREICKFFNGI